MKGKIHMNKSIEIEKRITESKLNGDKYRQMSQERNFNPDLTLPNTLDFNNDCCKKHYIDNLVLNK